MKLKGQSLGLVALMLRHLKQTIMGLRVMDPTVLQKCVLHGKMAPTKYWIRH